MAKLKITRGDGTVLDGEITPKVEYLFEVYHKKGFYKSFREDEMQTAVYYVAWLVTQEAGETVKPFGVEFIESLKKVEVDLNDSLT
ncbi:hypothetical protein UFOVP1201_20 [uncultured Caudovirales phage]|uniref:Phage protein n=1 Tax=uncultured Caudovirales phage TaxID=2100421 RepID=A0A6J5R8G8_9CAUD|nr:hypothetical protein UFOVP788_13 [uncultured Caudovirales phage]CAB4189841.1 hypothetical protein UFOVP1201_20 [uncultured Caudovirales phage]